jgi:glycosyltransferase involved in cell wall biosynthesis
MRRLVFITQQVDPAHPALAATVRKVAALAARVDELVVLADGVVPAALPSNVRARTFRASSRAGRGVRFEVALAAELRPRPLAVVAHMCPIYAVLAAPLVRPLRIPLALWFTHWKASRTLALAERVSTHVLSVDRRTFPLPSRKVTAIGHGIDVDEFTCRARREHDGLDAVVVGRTSPAKGIDVVVDAVRLARERGAAVSLDGVGPSLSDEERRYRSQLARRIDGADGVRLLDPVPRDEVPALLERADVLVNNMREGATDKAVYEAGASCVPVLASNRAFDSLLEGLELDFPREDAAALADRLARLASLPAAERTRIGHVLRERVVAGHSVDAWAEKLLAVVA